MEQTVTALVKAIKHVRLIDPDHGPVTTEIRLQYYDGFLQKAKGVNDIKTQ